MSLNSKSKLSSIALELSRQLRKNSTEADILLWKKLKAKKFFDNKFLRQYAIFHDVSGKETFFIADFYCHKSRLVIEIDGEFHKYRLTEDLNRTEILNQLGLKVIRFSNTEIINSLKEVLKSIEKELK